MANKKNFFWEDMGNGFHFFYFSSSESSYHEFHIIDVPTMFAKELKTEVPEEFKDRKFDWHGCVRGVCYRGTLAADNIEDAKKEFEAWYGQFLSGQIEKLKKDLTPLEEQYECFLLYQNEG